MKTMIGGSRCARGTNRPYRVMVGSDAKLMDRLYRLNPRRAAGFIANQMKSLLGT